MACWIYPFTNTKKAQAKPAGLSDKHLSSGGRSVIQLNSFRACVDIQ